MYVYLHTHTFIYIHTYMHIYNKIVTSKYHCLEQQNDIRLF
jgi:hypothetical protein